MLLASALVMAATGEASAQSASPEQPPSEATHFAQVDSSKLSTALNGKTLIPTIEIGYKASTANPAIINGHPAMFPVKTLIYPDGRENFRIEYGILHADANQYQSFKSGMRFQVTKVIIKDDCLELEIPMFTEGAILDKSFRGDVKFMFGKGWQSSMTTESVLQTVMRYLPDTETIAKAKAEAERVRAEEAETARIAAEQAQTAQRAEAERAKAAAEQARAEAQAKADTLAAQRREESEKKIPPALLARAKAGDAEAQYEVGHIFASGDKGIEKDDAEAAKWFRKAADQGNADGQYKLGFIFYNGQGVPQDYAEAMKWFRKAVDQGDADAQNALGAMYYHGYGVPKDYAEAMKWYRKAVNQGNAEAQSNIGGMYANGEGVPQDYAEAAKWYRKAADQGNADGQVGVGVMYQIGQGVPKDDAEAMKWYRKAADQGDADAQEDITRLNEERDAAAQQKAADAYRRTPEGKQQCQADCNSAKSRCESNNITKEAIGHSMESGMAAGLVLGSIKNCNNEESSCHEACTSN
jgi:TPR repeat protein